MMYYQISLPQSFTFHLLIPCIFSLFSFHVSFSSSQHVLVEDNHSQNDTTICESEEIVMVLGDIGVTLEIVIEDQSLSNGSKGIQDEETIVSEKGSDGAGFVQIEEISVNFGNRPHDHHSRVDQPVHIFLNHQKSQEVPTQDLEESCQKVAFSFSKQQQHQIQDLKKLNSPQNSYAQRYVRCQVVLGIENYFNLCLDENVGPPNQIHKVDNSLHTTVIFNQYFQMTRGNQRQIDRERARKRHADQDKKNHKSDFHKNKESHAQIMRQKQQKFLEKQEEEKQEKKGGNNEYYKKEEE